MSTHAGLPEGIERFTKKKVMITATQWAGTAEDATRIINWVLAGDGIARYHDESDPDTDYSFIEISTLEGDMEARAGYYIIKGIKGEFYPCETEIFYGSYDDVDTPLQEAILEFESILKLAVVTLGVEHATVAKNNLRRQVNKIIDEVRKEDK